MSVSSLSTLMRKASDINSEIGEVGYFAALNLNYDSSAYEAKRNAEQLLRELNAELQGYEEMFGNDDNEEISFKSEIEYKRKLLQKIQYAAKILTDDGLRSDYLYEIQLRCYLSQAFTLAELKDRYSGRVFPFFMFEVSRKNGGLFQDGHHRFLRLNFIDMIIEEMKDNQVLRGFNCSSIKQIMPGFSVDEFYLSVENGEEQHTHHYQMKYWQQRELLIELVNFSKIAAQKRAFVKSEKMQNPNVSLKDFDKADDVASNILGTKPKSTSRPLKILFNDRVTPHKLLYQCQVYRKRSSLLAFDKKIWMTIGTSNIILSSDKEMKSILQIFPIAKDSVSFVKISDKGDFSIIINENKSCFHSCNAADADTILSLGKEITKGNFEYEQVITSLPYNKKDLDVSTLLFKKFNQINEKICETKELLTKLRTQRAEIKNMMIKEKQKTRSQTIYSTESKSIVFSKTSVSNDDNFPKSQVSLFTLDEKDENLPSIAYLSQSSISASPFKRERLHAMTEVLDSPYSFGKEKDDIDSADDLNSNLTRGQKEKTSMKTLGGERKGKTPLYRRQDSKASSMNLSSQGFETRRATRFMSARIQMKTERALSNKQMPVSMKELTKEEDGMANFSQDFQGQSLMNNFVNGEVKRNQQGYGDRTVRNSKNEISGSERKRQKLDV